jgi:hypothetical protein
LFLCDGSKSRHDLTQVLEVISRNWYKHILTMARSLAKANVTKAIKAALGQEPDPAALAPGHMRLYSFYAPSLLPSLYGIEATQTITSTIASQSSTITVFNYSTAAATNLNTPDGPANPNAPVVLQQFKVIAPQFSIDPKVVNSVYPPPGYTDEGTVLPHIVFNDPHLPWDRPLPVAPSRLDRSSPGSQPPPPPQPIVPKIARTPITLKDLLPATGTSATTAPTFSAPASVVSNTSTDIKYLPPWMALVVFDADELKLTSADETTLGIPIPPNPAKSTAGPPQQVGPNPGQISTPGAYPMSVSDYLTQVKSRTNYEAGFTAADQQPEFAALKTSGDPTSIIFPKKDLVATIFLPTIQFLLMSHVRQINTLGFPDAGVEEEEGLYSVCISKRTGPTSYPSTNPSPVPVTQVVHLVSLEYIQESDLTSTEPSDRIGLVSLYSWTYLAVPPDPVNFQTIMTNLATKMQMLRPPELTLQAIQSSVSGQKTPESQAAAQHLYDRLSLGYTISRWRTSVGQETVAFTRGPLTPLPTPWKPSVAGDWPGSSNSGKEYQILDQDLGVMDVSYSAAWQLGKLLAISDTVFNQALFRFRSLVHQFAASETRKQVNAVASKDAILKNIPNAVEELQGATDGSRKPVRLILPSTDKVAPPLSSPQVVPTFKINLIKIIDAQTAAGEAIYTDYNLGTANNTDWSVINAWISDKLFLGGIPAQYLFPDPSLLPSEALRFFYIDSSWMDCFIDGALSVANHLEPVDDKVRRRIKDVYNVYLRNNIDPAPVKPPVPEYGFILRSALIKVMPDIRITVTCRTGTAPNFVPDTTRAPLVRLTKMDDYTILALLTCLPEEIYSITFAQPPHQQRYVAAAQLLPTPVYQIRQLYTANAPEGTGAAGVWPSIPASAYPSTTEMAKWYDAPSRCVNIIAMCLDINTALNTTAPNFSSAGVDSVVMALELNDRSYQISILPPVGSSPGTAGVQNRQLWVGVDVDDPDDPIPVAQPVSIPAPTPVGPVAPGSGTGATVGAATTQSPAVVSKPAAPPITVHPQTTTTTTPANKALPLNLSISKPLSSSPHTNTLSATTTTATAAAAAAAATPTTLTPQFTLTIHPSYRGPAPLPYTSPTDGSVTYSSKDFIPTATNALLNLIFSLQHTPPVPAIPYPLVELEIEIPIDTDAGGGGGREALLTGVEGGGGEGAVAGIGVNMLTNTRLIPFLTTTLTSSILTITLTPRDALPNSNTTHTTVPAANISDASFLLTGCTIADILHPRNVKVVGGDGGVTRGTCEVKVRERYLVGTGGGGGGSTRVVEVEGRWSVVKRDGGEVDLSGNPV